MALDDDQCGAVLRMKKYFIRSAQHIEIIRVAYASHVPAIAQKSAANVFRKRDPGRPFDRDVIVVVYPAEVGKLEMSCERRRFTANAFHQTTIAAHRVNVISE